MTFQSPTKCPSCQLELTVSKTGVDLMCLNTLNCPAQILGRLAYFTKRDVANIIGLSDKILQKMYENFGVRDISDLYNLPYEDIFYIEGFGRKSIDNLKNSVEKARNIQDYKLLTGLCIEGVGPEVAKLICSLLEG